MLTIGRHWLVPSLSLSFLCGVLVNILLVRNGGQKMCRHSEMANDFIPRFTNWLGTQWPHAPSWPNSEQLALECRYIGTERPFNQGNRAVCECGAKV
jgi:hypothetical protein